MKRIKVIGTLFLTGWMAVVSAWAGLNSTAPLAEQVTAKKVFAEPLLWVGSEPPSDSESEALLQALDVFQPSQIPAGIAALEKFLDTHTNSAWSPSLLANLATYHRDTGRHSRALDYWQRGWHQLTGKSDRNAVVVGDYLLTQWLRLLASLGRSTEMKVVLGQIEGRKLSRIDWRRSLAQVRQAVETMESDPGVSFKCGTLALYHVGQKLGSPQRLLPELLRIPSPVSGFSLSALADIARTNGLKMQVVQRTEGHQLVVPSVIHWRQNHYAAMTDRRGDFFLVMDPTFGGSQWLKSEVINEEASGYFMVSDADVPTGWVVVDPNVANTVYGRGYPNYDFGPPPPLCQPTETTCCPPGGSGGGGRGGGGGGNGPPGCGIRCGPVKTGVGMPEWDVTEPDTSLALYDKPMFYQPALGEEFALMLAYRQRESRTADTNLPSFGPYWSGGWIDFLEVTPDFQYLDYAGFYATNFVGEGGGGWVYTSYSYPPNGLARDPRTGTTLERFWNTNSGGFLEGFKLTEPNGTQKIYKFTNMLNAANGTVRAFLTERIVLPGYTNRFVYVMTNSFAKLVAAVDADGRTNTVFYENTNFPAQITKVTNPYGNSVVCKYDGDGLLTNVIDVVGLGTSFAYDDTRIDGETELVRMTTPYGDTSFKFTGLAGGYLGGITNIGRSVLVTEPSGGNYLFRYREGSEDVVPYISCYPSDVPEDFTGANNVMGSAYTCNRNSFFWGPRQYDNLSTNNLTNFTSADYTLARRRNYLHKSQIDPDTGAASVFPVSSFTPVLNMEQEPSPDGTSPGQRTWYGYIGKPYPYNWHEGTNRFPYIVAKVLPDGTTNYFHTVHNSSLRPIKEVTTASSGGVVYFRTNTYTYAANGIDRLTHVGPDGAREFGYAYNGNHQVLFVTNALNEVTSYTYDSATKLLTSVKTPAGLTTTNIYDGSNRLVKTIDLEINRTNTFTYANGLVHTHSDERGLTVTNAYDAMQRLVAVYFPDGTYASNQYSRLDLVGQRDRLGNWTTYAYSSIRQQTAVTNAMNKVTLHNYCNCGALDSTEDALNNTTSFYYDKAGRQVATVFADGSWVTNNYNSLGQVTNLIQSPSLSVTNWYNNQGLLVSSSNAFGRVHSVAYDVEDRATNTVDANGVSTSLIFDALDRVVARTYPDTGVERFAYTARGLVAHTNQLGKVTRFFYDEALRKILETNANLEITEFKYDASGNLTNLIDGKSQSTYWRYDLHGLVTNKLDHLKTNLFVYQYDANHRLTNRWSAAKTNTHYSYDAVGNLTLVNYPNSPDITLNYDDLNRVTNMVDAVGTTIYSYDSVGQLLSEDGPWENDAVSYTYTNRLRSGLSLSQPNASAWAQSYGYHTARRLTNITSPGGAFSYVYHAGLGGITASASLVKQLVFPSGAKSTNAFDSVGRLTEIRLRNSGGTLLDQHDYVVNAGNQRTKQTRTAGDFVDYTYDDIGQLKSALGQELGGTTNRWHERFFYGYDKAGNLSNRVQNVQTNVFHVDSLNQLTSVVRTNASATVAGATTIAATNVSVAINGPPPLDTIRYADRTFARTNATLLNGNNTFSAIANDNLGRSDTHFLTVNLAVAVSFLYDQNGNLRTNGSVVIAYDDENQLVAITNAGAWASTFTYDGKMRMRLSRDYAWVAGAWVQTNEVRRVYDGMLVLQERDQFNVPKLTYTRGKDLSGSLEGAGGIGGLLAMTESSSLAPLTSYFHSDGNGNVTCLVDTNQNVVASYLYDPFGNTLSATGPKAMLNKYRFSSKESHAASGLIYYGYRWYVPELQRWLNGDPIKELGHFALRYLHSVQIGVKEQNSYAFVKNSPLDRVDILGLDDRGWPLNGVVCNSCIKPQDYGTEVYVLINGQYFTLPAGKCTANDPVRGSTSDVDGVWICPEGKQCSFYSVVPSPGSPAPFLACSTPPENCPKWNGNPTSPNRPYLRSSRQQNNSPPSPAPPPYKPPSPTFPKR